MANDLYIVDNLAENRTVKHYLTEWCDISKQIDVATGYFEVGGLLELAEKWQGLDKIRIIMGSEVTKRTSEILKTISDKIIDIFDESIEHEKQKNTFLIGVPAIMEALRSRKIECRVFDKDKFHAKAYITYFKDDYHSQFIPSMNIPSGYALVGSSNFTKAGLTKNIELNVQVTADVDALQEWFDARWNEAIDLTDAILQVIEKHCRDYSPFDIYIRSMY